MSKRKRLTLENKREILSKFMKFRARSCVGKKRYGRIEADRSAKRFHQRPYLCHFCGCWHLTKNVATDAPES